MFFVFNTQFLEQIQPKTVGIRSKPKGASEPETARTHSPGDSTLRVGGINGEDAGLGEVGFVADGRKCDGFEETRLFIMKLDVVGGRSGNSNAA